MKVAVSYLKSKYSFDDTINNINRTDADYIHVDVMDGIFVENKTSEYEDISESLIKSKKIKDVHLMVNDPIKYIMDYRHLNPEFITIHSEINKNLYDLFDLIHSYGIKCGISIKPNTNIESIENILNIVDNVLIMSVEPGKGGQSFNESVVYKIDILNKLREENNYHYLISIDGGINSTTINKVRNVDFVISGSFICESNNYQDQINELR